MSILKGDIRLMASQRMADTDDGGGKMTATEIVTGQHNTMFSDISDLDRAFGRVQLRKVFLSVDTPDTDVYYGACVAVLEPPQDPTVAITLFSTGNYFDERADAQDRVERYLARGPRWQGYLYDTQVEGQRAIRFFQRLSVRLPEVGEVFALVADEGKSTEKEQYVRVTKVSTEERKFLATGYSQEFVRLVVTCEISDPLRYTFPGNVPTPYDDITQASAFRETVVADATFYFGASSLTQPAAFKSREVWVESIFTQLVPSARTETPVVDINAGGASIALVAGSNNVVTMNTNAVIGPNKGFYLGTPAMLSSLVVTITGGPTITEKAGQLYLGDTIIGTLSASNGYVSYNENCPTSYGTNDKQYTFLPAAAPTAPSETWGVKIDANNRGYAYVYTMEPLPTPGSLRVSFKSQNKWYDLYDQGDGAIKGSDSSFGSGSINYATGSLMLTLGALPDVGTAILFSWAEKVTKRPVSPVPVPPTINGSTPEVIEGLSVSFKVNALGGLVDSSVSSYSYGSSGGGSQTPPLPAGPAPTIDPTSFKAVWANGTKALTSDANGFITGDATGLVDANSGLVTFMPRTLPEKGDTLRLEWKITECVTTNAPTASVTGSTITVQYGASPRPGSVRAVLRLKRTDAKQTPTLKFDNAVAQLRDDGAGNLSELYSGGNWGTIDYVTGQAVIQIPSTYKFFVVTYKAVFGQGYAQTGAQWEEHACSYYSLDTISRVSSTVGEARTAEVVLNNMKWSNAVGGAGTLIGGATRLDISGTTASDAGASMQVKDPETGAQTAIGSIDTATGDVTITTWTSGATNSVVAQSLAVEMDKHLVTHVHFRTPGAPVAPSSLFMQITDWEGKTYTTTFEDSGIVDTGVFHGTFSYEHGIGLIKFGPKVLAAGNENEDWYNPDSVDSKGYIIKPLFVDPSSILYNCVTYSYLPIDASVLKLDPVRLPSDGRVPIFRVGGVVIVHNTATHALPDPVPNAYSMDLGRTRLTDVVVRDAKGVEVPDTLWTVDKVLGTFSMVAGASLADYTLPLTVYDRIEDMAMVSDVEISGRLTLTKPLTHDYPKEGTYVSSALIVDDLWSRVGNLFDQATWTNEWSDNVIGSTVSAEFNDAYYPIKVYNRGGVTERFALVFTSSTSYNVLGEHLGFIASGTVNENCAPVNPSTNTPLFVIDYRAFGGGWPVGGVLRFNTYGASYPFWVARTILQSEAELEDDKFGLQLRGNVNR